MKLPLISDLRTFLSKERGFLYVTMGNITTTFLGASFWLILASLLNVSQYGEINYIIAISSILSTIASLGLNTTLTTYLAKGEQKLIHEATSIILVTSIAIATLTLTYSWIASLLTLALTFYGISLAIILGRKAYKEYAITSALARTLQILLSILLYLMLGLTGITLGYTIAFTVLSYRYYMSLPNFTLNFNHIKEKINFTLHSYGLNLINSLSTYLDKIIIGILYSYHELGLYHLAYQFLMFARIMPASLYSYLLPEEAYGQSKKQVKILGIAFSIALFVIIVILTPLIIKLTFPKYAQSTRIIQIMSLAIIPITIINISNATLYAKEKSKYTLIGGGLFITIQILLIPILYKMLGIIGLAITQVVARSIQATYTWSRLKYT